MEWGEKYKITVKLFKDPCFGEFITLFESPGRIAIKKYYDLRKTCFANFRIFLVLQFLKVALHSM